MAKGLPLLFQPGSNYAYGMGLDVLGHAPWPCRGHLRAFKIMEIVTGKTLQEIIRRRAAWHFDPFEDRVEKLQMGAESKVLEPTGMRDSCFSVAKSKLKHLAGYYRLMREPV